MNAHVHERIPLALSVTQAQMLELAGNLQPGDMFFICFKKKEGLEGIPAFLKLVEAGMFKVGKTTVADLYGAHVQRCWSSDGNRRIQLSATAAFLTRGFAEWVAGGYLQHICKI